MNLEPIEIPRAVAQPAGCNCGGNTMHRTDCTIFNLPAEQQRQAIDEACQRVDEWAHAAASARGWVS